VADYYAWIVYVFNVYIYIKEFEIATSCLCRIQFGTDVYVWSVNISKGIDFNIVINFVWS
jgi:hypothetical protein